MFWKINFNMFQLAEKFLAHKLDQNNKRIERFIKMKVQSDSNSSAQNCVELFSDFLQFFVLLFLDGYYKT